LTPSKILLIRLRRIGDVVMTTPAVALLKKHFPETSLTYLVEEPYRRLVEGNPHLDRVITTPPKQKLKDFVRLIGEVRKEKYDVLLDFHGGPRASWITFWSGARLKVGYTIKNKSFLYDIRVSRQGPNGPIHSVQNHANLVRALGAAFDEADIPPLFLPEPDAEEIERVQGILGKAGAGGAGEAKVVVLHIGAGNRFRDWGLPHIAALIKRLGQIPAVKVALIGGEGDQRAEAELLTTTKNIAVPLAGRLNLIEIKELIARAALFIGPDSGPMHIAAATATPIVAYFGPTLPSNFAPWRTKGSRTVLLEKDVPCRPCKQRECVTNDFRCLLTITPEEVFAACRPYL
jgi:heptosyltransferase-1